MTRHNCGGGEGAGVVCVDAAKLNLKGGTKRDGGVYIGNYPVCDDLWETRDAQVVCNQLYGHEFQERNRIVPVFAVLHKSRYGRSSTHDFIMDNVGCTGKETLITQCSFHTHPQENCGSHEVAGVKCAKCTIPDLLNVLNKVEIRSTIAESLKTVNDALASLGSKCYAWNCGVQMPAYPEYCMIKAFLDEAKGLLSRKFRKEVVVSLKFNPGKLLQHQFTREQSTNLLRRLDNMQAQGESFQKQLADYYTTVANFDRDKAVADHTYISGVWNTQRRSIAAIQGELGPDLDKLFGFAFAAQAAEIRYRAKQLALAIASLASPADAVFNPGEFADKASNILEKTAELADSVAEMANLGYTFGATFPKFAKLAKELKSNFDANKKVYQEISAIVGISSMSEFTPEKAKAFLKAYNDYTPAINAEQLARYKVLIDQIVENTCEVITAPGGVIKAAIKLAATSLCPRVKQNVEILKDLLDDMKSTQLEVMDAFADFAQAKVSEMAARELSKVVGRSSTDVIQGRIASKQSGVLFQLHKTILINSACDYIKYTNYGVEERVCQTMRGNTFNDLGNLVSYNYQHDRMCSDQNTRRGTFVIPAMMRRGNEVLPKGTLDLTQLLDPSKVQGMAYFQIPNSQWLVDNGWIASYEKNKGPFFVKQLQLHPLPTLGKRKVLISSEFTLIDNLYNEETVVFDADVHSVYAVEENNHLCNQRDVLKNPYSLRYCPPLGDVCARSDGKFHGPVYPSLMALWQVEFKIPKDLRVNLPFPVKPIMLKVEAEICYRQASRKREEEEEEEKRSVSGRCCASKNQFLSKDHTCQKCPPKSVPKLNGYYCESCPKGYEPASSGTRGYGCKPCPENKYKQDEGNSNCVPCRRGMTTKGGKGSAFCVPNA